MMSFWQRNSSRRFPRLADVGESLIRLWRPLLVTSLLVTGGMLGMRYLGLMQSAELAAYDQLMRLQPNEPEDERILVVGITDSDLQMLQEANISDRTLAQALENLAQHQPHTIAVDIFRDFPHEPGWQELTQTLRQNSNIVIICKASATDDPGTAPPPNTPAENVGFADLVVDPGGILRRSLLLMGTIDYDFPVQHLCNQPNQTLLALSFQAAMRYLADQGRPMDFTDEAQLVLGSTEIPQIRPNTGGYRGADTAGYQIMLRYRSETQAVPEVSLMEVIRNQVDPKLIRDRIVFIGYTSPLLKDTFYTPYSAGKDDKQQMPGVIVHAQSTSQLISAVLDNRPLIWVWPQWIDILWIFAWSLVGGILGWYLRHPAAVVLFLFLGGGVIYVSCALIFTQGGWIPLVPATLTFLGTAVGVVLLDRFNNSAYGQRVYRSVKSFLRLDIEIDEKKIAQQVTEITETDYFQELQNTVERLRDSDVLPNTDQISRPLSSANELNALLESKPEPEPTLEKDDDSEYELDFIQQLNQQAQQLKQTIDGASVDKKVGVERLDLAGDLSTQLVNQPAASFTPFILDTDFCDYHDMSTVTQDHLADLTAKITALRFKLKN